VELDQPGLRRNATPHQTAFIEFFMNAPVAMNAMERPSFTPIEAATEIAKVAFIPKLVHSHFTDRVGTKSDQCESVQISGISGKVFLVVLNPRVSAKIRGSGFFCEPLRPPWWSFSQQNKKAPFMSEWSLLILMRRRPTLPHTFACSTIGPAGLNFRVRDGNGWNPRGMITANWSALGAGNWL
jgi:hypothetical protein